MKIWIGILLIGLFINNYAQDIAKTRTAKGGGKDAETYPSFTFDGAWCWFSDPRAVYFEGLHKRTYAGWIDRYGDVHVGYYDHKTGCTDSRVICDGLQVDDHDNPSILFDDEGRLLIFFNKHGGPNPLYFCKSEKPENLASIGRPERLALNDLERYPDLSDTYTYTNPVRLSEENGRIYLFWRGLDNKPNFAWSDDDGETWNKGGILILPERIYKMRRPYLKVSSDGKKRIHFAFTDGHPNKEPQNSIYYMYYESRELYKAGGEKIANLGDEVKPRQADCVYDAVPSGEKAWVWDVAADDEGNPYIAYARFPDDSRHVYSYARWNGKQWKNTDLVRAGGWFPETPEGETEREPNYSGGISIDHENPGILYLSVKRDSVFEIEKWSTKNGGGSWLVSPVTKGSAKDNVRPAAVRNAMRENPLQVLWMCNTHYLHYTDYQASIQMDLIREPAGTFMDKEGILEIMHRVADWQIMNPRKPHPLDWHYGAFCTGIWALYQSTGEERYKNEIKNLGQKHKWKLINDIYHADRLTIAQSFAELYMEEKDPARFENQFREMAAKLIRVQGEDGLWRVSLIDPGYLDMGESSGSSFFTYALAWGINNGYLDRDVYGPAVEKAWKALASNVNKAGRLGYVQQVAGSPYPFFDYQSQVYASGAFILAGSEMLKLIEDW